MLLLLLNATAQAEGPSAHRAVDTPFDAPFASLSLTQQDNRYALASVAHSSGFVPAPANLKLEDALAHLPAHPDFSLRPDFKQHERYWLYTAISNDTEAADWMLHISNFGYQYPRVLVQNEAGQRIQTINNTGYTNGTDINTLGLAGDRARICVRYSAALRLRQPHSGCHQSASTRFYSRLNRLRCYSASKQHQQQRQQRATEKTERQ